ncbi:MAG TPA: DUF1015 domain-containing protein [Gemmataceae bacterium]|nr:DUF1015 domain-containing protein [Gemmataceae bacterium]
MADIRAFRAFRYDLGKVGALSDVVCPPYDVIDATLQQTLYDRSPFNVIRLELNKPEPADTESSNRYSRAAGFLRDWKATGVLRQDSARSLYVLHQEYEVDGRRHLRKGFFARVRLEPFGQGKVYAHEETLSGPKEDRRLLLRATGMNLSPVFGLFPDEGNEVQRAIDEAVRKAPPFEATDHLGVVSRLWPIADEQVITKMVGLMGPRPIFIADGHHRYETGVRYLQESRQAGEVADEESPQNFILMNLVSMSDPGLLILPTHRLVSGLPNVTAERIRTLFGVHLQMEKIGVGNDAFREAWERIQIDGSQSVLGFGTVADGIWQVGKFHSPAIMDSLAREHSPDWRSLAVSILHTLALEKLVREGLGALPSCRYVHLLREVQDAVSANECALAVLVPPATMGHVERIAGNLEKMPPKSTYFYPKLLSGLVFNSVKGN